MRRSWIYVTACLLPSSWILACSLTGGPSDLGLTTLWSVDQELGLSLPTSPVGSLDGSRFYAIREELSTGDALVAYDRTTGDVAWRQTVSNPCTAVPVGDRVYCAADYVHALDAATGRQVWRYGTGRIEDTFQLVTATADAQRVYAGHAGAADGSGRVTAVDAATGTLVWERAFDGPWAGIRVRSLALSPEGDLLVAFTGEFDPPAIFSAAVIAAVDPATGAERWRYVDGDETTDLEVSDLAFWGPLMLYSDGGGRAVVAVDRRTRQVVWRAPITQGQGAFLFGRAPAVVGDRVYYMDSVGGAFAVEATSGASIWSSEGEAGFYFQLACGSILFGNDQRGSLFAQSDGRYLGRLFDDDTIPGQAAVADGVLFVSTSTGVYAFECPR